MKHIGEGRIIWIWIGYEGIIYYSTVDGIR